jgi:hypothetical protein
MYVLKKVSIGGADVKIVVTLHSSTQARDFLDLATGGDENHIMKFMAWMNKKRVTIDSMVGYLLKKIALDTIDILKSNRPHMS